MSCKHYKIKVEGKVQGVWFRKYTQEKAQALNLKGFVRNEPDGSVYIEAEHENETILNQLVQWLYRGSPLSEVHTVHVERNAQCQNFKDFRINR